MPTDLHLYGIRHHGPGSTASLLKALNDYQPDIVLLECPADGEKALALAANPELKPPVALLIYNPKQHAQASFLPLPTSPQSGRLCSGASSTAPTCAASTCR